MFTSGSTGVPKGVPILDYQVVNLTDWLIHDFKIKNTDVLTGLNPWYFDNSVFDIHMSLLSGANLVICDTVDSSRGFSWIEALALKEPTVWFSVPSLLILVQSLGSFKENRLRSLRLIILGGEAYPKNLLNELMVDQGTRTDYVSVYGPTETTCICSTANVTQKELESGAQYISLGNFPSFFVLGLHNTYLLSSGELAGELMLGGVNVAAGYAQVENNFGKFLNLPDMNGDWSNYYLTGDLVYFNEALKSYCFLGRKDNQIKRLGIRIELEEIESRLEKASGTVVIADYDSGRILDLCILFVKSESVNEDFIEKICKDFLPPYMLPRRVIGANELPLNPNGKKDRRAAKQRVKLLIGQSFG
jgi:D-alanine--poly(phosphoribitol) ligase subunit 1